MATNSFLLGLNAYPYNKKEIILGTGNLTSFDIFMKSWTMDLRKESTTTTLLNQNDSLLYSKDNLFNK